MGGASSNYGRAPSSGRTYTHAEIKALYERHRKGMYAGREAAWQRFLDLADPDRSLPEHERIRRAQLLRRAHMARLALRSSRKRTAKVARRQRSNGDSRHVAALMGIPEPTAHAQGGPGDGAQEDDTDALTAVIGPMALIEGRRATSGTG